MLFGMMILCPVIKEYKDTYYYIIAPIIFLVLLGYLSHKFPSLKAPFEWTDLFTYKGNLRAIMELSFGTILYKAYEYIRIFKFKKWVRIFMTFIEIFGYLFIIFVMTYTNRYDFIILFMFGFLILLSFSKITYTNKLLSYKFINYLGAIRLPIYIFQNCAILIMKKFYYNADYYHSLPIYIYLSILFGIVSYHLINYLKSKKLGKIKKLIIEEKSQS